MGIVVWTPQPQWFGEGFTIKFRKEYMTVQVEMRLSSACQMAYAKQHTINMATRRYGLGIYADKKYGVL